MAKPKVAKKEWYPIIAPKIFKGVVIGETVVYDPDKMIGKSMSENLMNLTNFIIFFRPIQIPQKVITFQTEERKEGR